MQGIIKYQCTDRNGLYSWEKRNCKLDVSLGTFEIFGIPDIEGQKKEIVSLREVKFAKEWSFSSALSGFGFDILWSSGKVWSFLVDDEISCSEWVKQINFSITKLSSDESCDSATSNQIINESTSSESNEHSQVIHKNRVKLESIIEEHKTFLSASSELVNNDEHNYDNIISVNDHHSSYFPSVPNQSFREPTLSTSSMNRHNQQLITSTILDEDSTIFQKNNKMNYDPLKFGESMELFRDSLAPSIIGIQSNPGVDRYGIQEKAAVGLNKEFESIFESNRQLSKNFQDRENTEVKLDTSKLNLGNSVRSIETEKESFVFQGQQTLESQRDFYNPSATVNLSAGPTMQSNSYGSNQLFVGKTSQPTIKSLDTIYTYQALIKSLQIKCQDSEDQLRQNSAAFEKVSRALQEKLTSVQSQVQILQQENIRLEQQMQDMSSNKAREVKQELLKVKNENYSFYESNMKSMELQHQRELQCLQDELFQLRRNGALEKENSQATNQQQEETFQKCLSELDYYKHKLELIESQLNTVQRSKVHLEEQSLQRFQEMVNQYEMKHQQQYQAYETKLAQVQKQHEDNLHHASKFIEDDNMQKYQRKMKELKEDIEKHYLDLIYKLQQDHLQALDYSKHQQLKIHVQELESLKSTFLQREHQISQDLILLEKLHSERIQSYEQQMNEKQNNIENLQSKLAENMLRSDVKEQTSISQYQDLHKKFTQLQVEYHEVYSNKLLTQQNLDLLQQQFTSLREQAIEALSQTRILKHENQELQKLFHESRDALNHLQNNIIPDADECQRQQMKELRILREENRMLESELGRHKNDITHFQQQCANLEALVYGIPQHKSANQNSNFRDKGTVKSEISGNYCEYCADRYCFPNSTTSRVNNASETKMINRATHSYGQSTKSATTSVAKKS